MTKDRIERDQEVTVWTYESPNSIKAYVTKIPSNKKKTRAKLALHQDGVSKYLKTQMANLTDEAFRHTFTKLRVEGAASKKKAAKASPLEGGGLVTGHRGEGASRSKLWGATGRAEEDFD